MKNFLEIQVFPKVNVKMMVFLRVVYEFSFYARITHKLEITYYNFEFLRLFSFIIHNSNVILCVLLHSPLWHELQLYISQIVFAVSIQKCWDKFPYLQDSTF